MRQPKRAVRLMIEDVIIFKTDHITAHIRFKGGAAQTISVALPPPFAQSRLTAPETLAEMDRLLEKYTDAEVAEQLNQRGYGTFDGLLFQSIHVYQLRRHHGISDRYVRLRTRGMLTAEELAKSLGVSLKSFGEDTIKGVLLECGTMIVDRLSFPQKNQQPSAESN